MKGKWSAWPAMLGVVFLMLLILPAAARAEVTLQEWTIPTPNSQPHDIITDDQGIAWFTEIAANQIGRFDPFKQEFMEFPLPTMNGNPHGICVAPDNGIWFTEQGGNKIGRIDRDSFEITEFPLPNPNSGPHTPIYDGYGHIWFTQQSGNRIGRIALDADPDDPQIEQWQLPGNAGPYGIVPDADGNAWFCEFGGNNRLGRIDAATGEYTTYDPPTPNAGPRRLWFNSKKTILWITENRAHQLAEFDTTTGKFVNEWPTPSEGGQPYAITVDQNDIVWYSEYEGNKMVSFDPATEELTPYDYPEDRFPERTRFIYVDPFNRVWYENNGNSRIGVVTQE